MTRYIATAFYNEWDQPDGTHSVSLAFELDGPDPVAVAEEVWRRLNADDRPNRFMQRSMCAGDAVQLMDLELAQTYWLRALPSGWSRCEAPIMFTDDLSAWAALDDRVMVFAEARRLGVDR